MGFLRRLLGGGAEPAPAREAGSVTSSSHDSTAAADVPPAPVVVEPAPAAIVVLRHGMDVPDEEYLRRVAETEKPGAVDQGAILKGLSQPRWFTKDEWMASGAKMVADAYERELGINPAATGYWESTGPDGAKILVVFLRK